MQFSSFLEYCLWAMGGVFASHSIGIDNIPAKPGPLSSAQQKSDKEPVPDAVLAPYFALRNTDQRVANIGYRLLKANTPFCDTKIWNAGWQLHRLKDYGGDIKAAKAYNLKAGYTGIAAIAESGPADEAGMHIGDLLDINDKALRIAQGRLEWADIPAAQHKNPDGPPTMQNRFELSITRIAPNPKSLSVMMEPTCPSRFQIEPSRTRDAFADGELVSITTQLAELTRSDDELAVILAHEIAHNLLRHPQRLKKAKVSRGFLSAINGDAAIIKQTEIEADRLAVWLMANAGFDTQATIDFWTFYGQKYGKGIFSAPTHYRWKKRVGLFKEEIAKLATSKKGADGYSPPLLAAPPTIAGEAD